MVIFKKRPCKICRRWFRPNPRVGDSQMTCGNAYCKREWHRKKCAQWNKDNREYFKGIYLEKKLKDVHNPTGLTRVQHTPYPNLKLPRQEIEEVIGQEQLIIIEYIMQLFFTHFKEEIKAKRIENKKEIIIAIEQSGVVS